MNVPNRVQDLETRFASLADSVSGLDSRLLALEALADIGYIDLDLVTPPPAPPAGKARLFGLDQNGRATVEYTTPSGITFRFCRDNIFVAKTDEAGGLAPGDVVYINDAQGANPLIRKWIADGSLTRDLVGLCVETGALNDFVFVMTSGLVSGLDTSGITAGLQAYASATVAGAFTGTEPTHPNLRAELGTVTRSHMTQGEIAVRPFVVRGDFEGTRRNSWKVGDNTTGAKDLVLRNGFDLTLRGNPTAARVLTLPDASGTLALEGGAGGLSHAQVMSRTFIA